MKVKIYKDDLVENTKQKLRRIAQNNIWILFIYTNMMLYFLWMTMFLYKNIL